MTESTPMPWDGLRIVATSIVCILGFGFFVQLVVGGTALARDAPWATTMRVAGDRRS